MAVVSQTADIIGSDKAVIGGCDWGKGKMNLALMRHQ